MARKQRVAIIGASCRGMYAFAEPLLKEYADTHEVVGLYDINPRRMQAINDFIHARIPMYDDFDRVMTQTKPDVVVISTIDATHVDYIEKAFRYGVSCISEKPLCTDATQCRRIRAAQASRGDLEAVTAHNYRYGPFSMKVKDVVDSGALGQLRSVLFEEKLDHRHGSSYFRRWNRQKKNSGGLLIHKCSHVFDLMNWWVGSRPVTVMARGSLTAYGPKASSFRGERCCTCPHAAKCPLYVDLSKDKFRGELYFRAREPGSYTPDLCVFSPEIDIEDHATVGYDYANGVQVTMNLCAYAGYEGVYVVIEGSKGRLEFVDRARTKGQEGSKYGEEEHITHGIRVYRFDQPFEAIDVPIPEGGHGGADPRMIADLFGAGPRSIARASLEDGIQAVLIGAAANVSIATGKAVDVQSLAK